VLGVKESFETLAQVVGVLGANGVQISSVKINAANKKQLTDNVEAVSEITIGIKTPNPGNMLKAMQSLSSIGAVVSMETNYSLTGTAADLQNAQMTV
jgi:flavorubredoxin